jgi:uncharacterized protein YcfL
MRTLLIAVMAVGILVGCGSTQRSQTVYARPGLTEAQLKSDQSACRQQAIGQAETKPVPTWGQTMNREAYDNCMRGLGYDVDMASASPRW